VKRFIGLVAAALGVAALLATAVVGQTVAMPVSVQIPPDAIALEGVPTARVDSMDSASTRRMLSETEAVKSQLVVKIVNGQYYWTSRDNHRLRLEASGPFTYLSSEPGNYIRFTRINHRVSYVEHVNMPTGSVTWEGELRVILKQ
jgi:hypothetical protein